MPPTEVPPTFRTPDEVLGDVYRKFETKRRHRRVTRAGIAAGVVALIVALGSVVWPSHSQHHLRVVGENGLAPSSAKAIANGTWSELPPAPISGRHDEAIVWTGDEMLVWGGDGPPAENDGAAYRPTTRTWRKLPSAPIGGRLGPGTVWTGRELLVWGGTEVQPDGTAHDVNTGAAFDPTSNRWRMLPPAPLTPRADTTVVWTGKEAIVVGGAAVFAPVPYHADAAAYDPVVDRWRSLPPVPLVPGRLLVGKPVAVSAGDQVLAWWPWADAPTTDVAHVGYDLFSYSLTTNAWTHVPDPPGTPIGIGQPVWTGTDLVVPTAAHPGKGAPIPGQAGARFDPKTFRWTPISHGPVDDSTGRIAWTGQALVRFAPDPTGEVRAGDGAVWDVATDRWTSLPRAIDPLPTNAVWTGREALLWGIAVRGLRFGPETSVERASLIDSAKARATCERAGGTADPGARLVAAFDSVDASVRQWQAARNGGIGAPNDFVMSHDIESYMAVCYFDGGHLAPPLPAPPPGQAGAPAPIYNRAQVEATADGEFVDGIGCFRSPGCSIHNGELDIQRP